MDIMRRLEKSSLLDSYYKSSNFNGSFLNESGLVSAYFGIVRRLSDIPDSTLGMNHRWIDGTTLLTNSL